MTAPEKEPALELRRVCRSFDGRPVLTDLDLVIPRGQVVALLGPSGAGKTTLLRVLSGALAPDSGTVVLLGRDLARLPSRQRKALRQRLGLLYQNDALVPGLRAVHNVLIGRLGHWSLARSMVSLLWPQEVGRVRAALREVQLEEKLYARVGALSGGQRQRVAIARLLVQDPDVLLADEPAAYLDPRLGRQAVEMLVRLARDRGKTLAVALHDIDLVTDMFDRVVALREGTWFWEGRPAELDRERLSAIYADERREAE